MRVASFFVTASVFASLFIGIALVSAVATREIHAQLSSRTFVPPTRPITGLLIYWVKDREREAGGSGRMLS
jgi:hypothetical protein